MRITQHGYTAFRQILLMQHTCADGIVNVVVNVGDTVCNAYHGALQGAWRTAFLVVHNAVPHFIGEVQPRAVFQFFHNAQTLYVVFKAAGHQAVQHAFACMAERCVTQIMSERDCLC